MTFGQAVRFFKSIGFEVEPGPRITDVTLRITGDGFVTVNVVPFSMLPAMAEVAAPIYLRNHIGNIEPRMVA